MISLIFRFLLFTVINAGLFWVLDHWIFLDTFTVSGGLWGYGFAGLLFGIVNAFLKPVLNLITLPFRILTLGILNLAINGVLLWIVSGVIAFVDIQSIRLDIEGVFTFFLAGILLGIGNYIFSFLRN